MSNEWFGRGELPPVGLLCEFTWGNQTEWHDCMRIDEDNVAFKWFAEWRIKQLCNAPSNTFRPIRTEREKAIEAAAQAFHARCIVDYSGQPFLDGLGALYDAGLLRLPEDEK
jgi:hypothetical protein